MVRKGNMLQKLPKMIRGKCGEKTEGKESVDRISQLPNCILLCIMAFMTTKEAVRTCVLSKRYKDLWKYVPALIVRSTEFQNLEFFKNFLCNFLLHRDNSTALHNVVVESEGYITNPILFKLFQYALSHKVEQFKIDVYSFGFVPKDTEFFCSIFSCHSLTSLDLSLRHCRGKAILPKTLDLPELINCHLRKVAFSSSDDYNGPAEPFSNCKKLRTLVIDCCTLHEAESLYILNENVVNLTVRFNILNCHPSNVQICTPNLISFTFVGGLLSDGGAVHTLFEHNLDFLEEARIEAWCVLPTPKIAGTLQKLLKRFNHIKSLTLSSATLEVVAVIPDFPDAEPVGFGNLKSLIVKLDPFARPPCGEALDYLRRDSQCAAATLTQALELTLLLFLYCSRSEMPSYYDEGMAFFIIDDV
ncbi:F-box/LRR-repeat protein 13-like [Gastrolobium bilobum]|uniref:F-box/LRR-repeat protein 13-like n=1 Tax=Gastrolobium bilobum TaxID=150636 RepID=UPI002AB21396|nr:F-box/LRR-repeat protein 13-like [Gastrolobium bilobum]